MDAPYTGALTPWNREGRLLWAKLGQPYDGFCLKVDKLAVVSPPLLVPAKLRQRQKLRACERLDVAVLAHTYAKPLGMVHRLPCQDVVQRLWGLPAAVWEAFRRAPVCIIEPHVVMKLMEKGSWSTMMLRASTLNRWTLTPPLLSRLEGLGIPPAAWLAHLKSTDRLRKCVGSSNLQVQPFSHRICT